MTHLCRTLEGFPLAIIYGVKEMLQDGAGVIPTLSIILGLGVGAIFVRRQLTLADPMIDIRLFRIPAFSAALATNVLGVFVAVGYFLLSRSIYSLCLVYPHSKQGYGRYPQRRGS